MAIEPVPYIDPAPVPGPQRGDESTFDDRMDAKIRWDETSAQQFADLADNVVHNAGEAQGSAEAAANSAISASNYASASQDSASDSSDSAAAANSSATNAAAAAAAAANSATGITASSTTSLAIGAGTKAFTVPAGKQFQANVPMVAASAGTPGNRMYGAVASYSGTTLTLTVTSFDGSGTNNDWNIAPSGAKGPTGGTAGGQLTGALDELKGSDLASAATIDPWSTGGNYMTLTGTATITALANAPQAGAKRTMLVASTPKITASANLVVKGGSLSLLAGDEIDVEAETTTKFRITVRRADGSATTPVSFRNVEVLTTSGTWTARVTGPHRVTLIAASGSGGSADALPGNAAAASGASTGGMVIKTFNAIAGQTYALVLGAPAATPSLSLPGTGASSLALAGNDAADSTFSGNGVSITAGGGKKGNATVSSAGNAVALGAVGGSASGGDYNFIGGPSGTATAKLGCAAATGGGAMPYRGAGYSSGNATATSGGSTMAATGGAGVGGNSGDAISTTTTALSSGGGALGSSQAANDTSNTGIGTVGAGANAAYPLLAVPLNLTGAGGTAGSGAQGGNVSGAGAGSGAVQTLSSAGITPNASSIGGGSGACVGVNAGTPGTGSGTAGPGGAPGGVALVVDTATRSNVIGSGPAATAFAIIES